MISPKEFLGFEVGADRKLANWTQICRYFELLGSSERMVLEHYGTSTEGRPLLLAIISSAENIQRLEEFKDIQERLTNPSRITDNEAQQLINAGRSIVLVTCSIHATEVGSTQMSMELAYELISRSNENVTAILDNVVLLLVPSLNPDGLDLVVDWYKKTLDTMAEGTDPPQLYHKYAGHDNNRDWFMLTQVENLSTVTRIHNVWHPHIIHDQHQMWSDGPRFLLPPYVEPYDPNVDPTLWQQINELSLSIVKALNTEGKTGVYTSLIFDGYSPARAYQHYHGGVRILSEAASVKIATPVTLGRDRISSINGLSWNGPFCWAEGEWHLRDIVEYDKTTAFACLKHAAKYRNKWLDNFYHVHKNAAERSAPPYAYVIPSLQKDPITAYELLEVLQTGLIKIETATTAFKANGLLFEKGDIVIRTAQPYGSYAKTLLEKQHYPDVRLYPGGPPKKPYDITAHSLPLQMGIECIEIEKPFTVQLEQVQEARPKLFHNAYMSVVKNGPWFYVRPETNMSAKIVNRIMKTKIKVSRLRTSFNELPAGTFLCKSDGLETIPGITGSIGGIDADALCELSHIPRIGLYKSFVPNADEGWTRFILEQYDFSLASITNHDIRNGKCSEYDALILPDQNPYKMKEGLPQVYPKKYLGGLDDRCVKELIRFVRKGGTLMAFSAACDYLIKNMQLPISNVVSRIKSNKFYVPGSFLRLLLNTDHPLTYGMSDTACIMFHHSPVFDVQGNARALGTYPSNDLLLSGWIIGEDMLHGKAGLVEVPHGKGKIILYGMRPQFRAQTRGTYKLVFNGIFQSVMRH